MGKGEQLRKAPPSPARRHGTWLPPRQDGMERWEQPQGRCRKGVFPPAPRSDPKNAVQWTTAGWTVLEHRNHQSQHPGAAQILAQKP